MADKDQGIGLLAVLLHLAQAFVAETQIAYRKNLVHQQDIRLHVHRH